ncbi:unnamed protein product [Hymenolepis diminuta]|uniref:Sperm microtubule inner protein 1 C-terminal domain-containing protein n=1 Tax=Hymenolepis diminuta TaxID=6216 RepID=A0A564YS90_HYMDI|nr:unnamed protein product [Hymenolepis diminuta]
MSRSYPIDTQSQRALQEIYEKESLAALKFFLLHHKPDEEDPPKLAAIKEIFQLEMPEKYSKLIEKRTKRKVTKRQEVNEEELSASTEEIALMRPVSSSTGNLLYGKHGETSVYLKQRLKLNPDEKYEMPVTTAMEYGWKLFQLFPKSEITHPRYGRTNIIERSFYRNGGVSLKMAEDIL